MFKLFGCPNSRSLRVAWALEEAGAAYEYVRIDLMKGEGRTPEFLAVNPGGKVPALDVGEFIISESGAILTWLGEHFPDSGLLPAPGKKARARCMQWMYFVVSELEQPLWTLAKARFALPPAYRVPAIEPTALYEFQRAARLLEQRLSDSPWLAGHHFSAADILASHCLAWARSAKVPLESEVLEAWQAQTWARPARERAHAREAATP